MVHGAQATEAIVRAIISLYPESGTDLHYQTHFQLVVAVILSAQTSDAAVNRVTPELFAKFPDAKALGQADREVIREIIQPLGLSNNKSAYIQKTAQMIHKEFSDHVPQNRKDLERLPGVGRKTASVIMTNAFGLPAFAVDSHTERICKRFYLVDQEATVRQVEEEMTAKLPKELWYQAHHSMLLFGRDQCPARGHDHQECLERVAGQLDWSVDDLIDLN